MSLHVGYAWEGWLRAGRTDLDRTVLYLYLIANGVPPWGGRAQIKALAMLCDWSDEKAAEMLEQAVAAGYARKEKRLMPFRPWRSRNERGEAAQRVPPG